MTFPSSLSHNLLGPSLEITVKYLLCSELWKIQLILKKPMPRKQLESWVFSIDETALNTGNSGSFQNRLLPFFYFSFLHWLKKNSSQKTVFFEIGKSLFSSFRLSGRDLIEMRYWDLNVSTRNCLCYKFVVSSFFVNTWLKF